MAEGQQAPAPHLKLTYRLIGPRTYIRHRAWRALRKARDGHEGELRLLPAIVPRDRTAVDVGANRGNYTFFLSRLATHTVAYEPAPPMARFLREARLTRVEVRESAVSNQAGTLIYYAPLNRHGRPQYNIGRIGEPLPAGTRGVELTVRVVRLDDEALDNVGFMKIDVEGHEYQVIDGARALLARCRPNLLVEILEGRGDRRAVAHNKTVQLLAELGYDIYVFARGALRPLGDAPLNAEMMNYIFLPRNGMTATESPQ